jgi:hypothetical protein
VRLRYWYVGWVVVVSDSLSWNTVQITMERAIEVLGCFNGAFRSGVVISYGSDSNTAPVTTERALVQISMLHRISRLDIVTSYHSF